MTNQQVELGDVSFKVSARTARMLGRENISNSIIGILELVRNSYDADATKVIIAFEPGPNQQPCLRIHDNGSGMSQEKLSNAWLVVGTPDKEDNPVSDMKRRVKVGNKGIGRLALDRLGSRAIVETKTKDGPGLELEINWERYDDASQEFHQVKHPLRRRTSLSGPFAVGTTITVTSLRDTWEEKNYRRLIQDLSLLVPPESSIKQFDLELRVYGHPELSGPIESPASKYALYTLDSTLEKDGRIRHKMKPRDGDAIIVKTTWKDEFPESDHFECGPLRFHALFFLRKPEAYKDLDAKFADIDSMLESFHGVRVYRDEFRVKPYGDPGGYADWLGLNMRRASSPEGVKGKLGAYRISENQLIGTVHITNKYNPLLRDQTNREGLFENQAFTDLRNFVLNSIKNLENQRQKDERQKKPKAPVRAEVGEAVANIATLVRSAAERVQAGGDTKTATELKAVEKQLINLGEQHKELQSEHQLLLGLSTLGIAMATFGHETQEAVNQIYNRLDPLKAILTKADEKRGLQHLGFIEQNASVVRNWGQFALDHVRRDKRTRAHVQLEVVAKNVLGYFEGTLEKQGIRLDMELRETPKVSAFPMDLEAVIINFLTNAMEAMSRTTLDKRFIKISTRYDPVRREITLLFADGGRGIADQHLEDVFNPFFTTKQDAKGRAMGTGLGLTIVKKIVEDELDGNVTVVGRHNDAGAQFTVKIPVRS